MDKQHTNRLIKEKSPYLLQHAHNPVDWYPWSEEAFEKARKEKKPVFLSIGYSTCHWCHVMEKESFENEEVAKIMNDTYVCIKVDREERPDLDNTYMMISQIMTGGGGWPLNIIMTPDKKPVFALTYIPRESRHGQMGIIELSSGIKELWTEGPDEVERRADEIISRLQRLKREQSGDVVNEKTIKSAYEQLGGNYDPVNGGFGHSPKFPSPHNLMFLLRYYRRTGDKKALEMVEHTLLKMRLGGVYDHIGFGFHRYSTDPGWFLPHFEKMLYDQGLLLYVYSEAYQVTRNEFYRKVAYEILEFLRKDMTDGVGAFHSAIDADSEGEEGKFYTWTADDVRSVLGEKDAELFMEVYSTDESGNYVEESTGRSTGRNIIFLDRRLEDIAASRGEDANAFVSSMENMRQKLLESREKRVHPHKDDKILSDLNGLVIAGLSKASQVFSDGEFSDAAKSAADFILSRMVKDGKILMHRYRDGEVSINGFLDDYAFMIWGLTELYQSTFETDYLEKALELNTSLIEHYWDAKSGGFYFTSDEDEEVLLRSREGHDSAIPSGNSVQMTNLIRFSMITGDDSLKEMAYQLANAFAEDVERGPAFHTHLISGINFAVGPSFGITITGKYDDPATESMISRIRETFVPNGITVLVDENDSKIKRISEFAGSLMKTEKGAVAYVCTDNTCKPPITYGNKLVEVIG